MNDIGKGRGLLSGTAALVRGGGAIFDAFAPRTKYDVVCFDSEGKIKWEDEAFNLVTNEGRFEILDQFIKLATNYASGWFVGLSKVTSPTFANADTLASHAGWTEAVPGTDYTGNRKTYTPGTITGTTTTSVDNSASVAAFACLTSIVLSGCFLCTVSSGTSGKLYAGGAFTGGDRSVVSGDTVNVTVTVTQA